jgi:hypothetical protein
MSTLEVKSLCARSSNEVYVRLGDFKHIDWKNRAHFCGICANLMRRILVDFARSHRSQKRGGGAFPVQLDEALIVSREPRADLVALDDALKELAVIDNRKSRLIELRFFGGLDVNETAEVLSVSEKGPMKPERWLRVEQLFHSALKVEESQRPAFLEDTCGGDQDLRREVELLLGADQNAESFLESPAQKIVGQAGRAVGEDSKLPGKTVSHYRILEKLGGGGHL